MNQQERYTVVTDAQPEVIVVRRLSDGKTLAVPTDEVRTEIKNRGVAATPTRLRAQAVVIAARCEDWSWG